MRGDQFSGEWRIMRATGGAPNGLIIAEISISQKLGSLTISQGDKLLPANCFAFISEPFDRIKSWSFLKNFKLKIPARYSLKEIMSPNYIPTPEYHGESGRGFNGQN